MRKKRKWAETKGERRKNAELNAPNWQKIETAKEFSVRFEKCFVDFVIFKHALSTWKMTAKDGSKIENCREVITKSSFKKNSCQVACVFPGWKQREDSGDLAPKRGEGILVFVAARRCPNPAQLYPLFPPKLFPAFSALFRSFPPSSFCCFHCTPKSPSTQSISRRPWAALRRSWMPAVGT